MEALIVLRPIYFRIGSACPKAGVHKHWAAQKYIFF